MTDNERQIFAELERRKQTRDHEEQCDSCDGSGLETTNIACADCLGQGILLYQQEYDLILKLSGVNDDSILEADIIG